MRTLIPIAFGLIVSTSAPAATDPLLDLNELMLRTMQAAAVPFPARSDTLLTGHLAAFDAVNAVEGRYLPYRAQPAAPAGATAPDAALGAVCEVLRVRHPSQQAAIDKDCAAGNSVGKRFGESVARALIDARKDAGTGAPNLYRPATTTGTYVPTVLPAGWDTRAVRPYAMREPSQFRPGPPPSLSSETWSRDFNESRSLGGRDAKARSDEQAVIARFWAPSGSVIYNPLIRQAAAAAGPSLSDRARVYALAYLAATDASIAVFDAKYHYNFWRPLTAIRNGDIDGNDATERDAGWTPLIDTPMHPEYPCAHCIGAAAVCEVLSSVLGSGTLASPLSMPTPLAPAGTGTTRSWTRLSDVVTEVSNARVWSGIHFRNSTEVGNAMGREIGKMIVGTQLKSR